MQHVQISILRVSCVFRKNKTEYLAETVTAKHNESTRNKLNQQLEYCTEIFYIVNNAEQENQRACSNKRNRIPDGKVFLPEQAQKNGNQKGKDNRNASKTRNIPGMDFPGIYKVIQAVCLAEPYYKRNKSNAQKKSKHRKN